jgi:hypothetical protein
MTQTRWLMVAMMLLSGCAHNYVYSGALEAEDSKGKMRQHVLYWNQTERPLWFDTAEGSVRLLPQCSLNTVAYDERPNGIVFRARPTDKRVIGEAEPRTRESICGNVLGANRITDLPEGTVGVTVWCEDAPQDDLDRPKPYLKARELPYEFIVSRREVPNFSDAGNVPTRPRCESP